MSLATHVRRMAALAVAVAGFALIPAPAPAGASIGNAVCGAAGLFSGIAGKACTVLEHGKQLVGAGKQLATGHVGGAVKTILGGGSSNSPSTASTAIGLAAIGTWVFGGAKFALHETAKVLGETTSPQLTTSWFSSAYWRVAGIAAVLTLPFLFAAAIQALLRSDLALLARAAFGYLPLAFLGVSIAAPLVMLLLAASDEMSAIVAKAGGSGGTHFLVLAGASAGLLSLLHGSPFLAFLVGLFTVAGAVVLWLELLAREAAIYVVVLMLPLAFASLVWPARRKWAIRSVELLVALILSKFAIVAVLALGGAALGHGSGGGVAKMLAGFVLVTMGAFAPWALLRLLPLAELASGAVGSFRSEGRAIGGHLDAAEGRAEYAGDWAQLVAARLRSPFDEVGVSGESSGRAESAATAEAGRLKALEPGPIAGGDDDLGGGSDNDPGPGPGSGGDGPVDGRDGGSDAGGIDGSEGGAGAAESLPGAQPSSGLGSEPEPPSDSVSEPGTRVLRLGLEENWPRPDPIVMPKPPPADGPVDPPTDGPLDPPANGSAGPAAHGAPTPPAGERGTTDDHDPRPPEQAPEDGAL